MARQQATATSWAQSIIRLSKIKLEYVCKSRVTLGTSFHAGSSPNHQSTGWDSNPRYRLTKAGSWPLDDQCNSLCGIEAIHTLSNWARIHHAVDNTSIPVSQRCIPRTGTLLGAELYLLVNHLFLCPLSQRLHQLARKESNLRPVAYKTTAPDH